MKIAVLGYGTVGSGVVEVLDVNQKLIATRAKEEIEVKYVLDLRDFPGDKIQEKIVHDYEIILNDPEIGIVVEVMGGVEPANTFVRKALEAGKSVVTSNKALVAKHGSALLKTAREKNVNFLFEASVGGGIPILRALGSSLTGDEIEEIAGILNGTTNYMMTRMFYEGATMKRFSVKHRRMDLQRQIRLLMWKDRMHAGRSRSLHRSSQENMWILKKFIPKVLQRSQQKICSMQRLWE